MYISYNSRSSYTNILKERLSENIFNDSLVIPNEASYNNVRLWLQPEKQNKSNSKMGYILLLQDNF